MEVDGQKVEGDHSTILVRICCACREYLGIKDAKGAPGGVSHGYCLPCLGKLRAPKLGVAR